MWYCRYMVTTSRPGRLHVISWQRTDLGTYRLHVGTGSEVRYFSTVAVDGTFTVGTADLGGVQPDVAAEIRAAVMRFMIAYTFGDGS